MRKTWFTSYSVLYAHSLHILWWFQIYASQSISSNVFESVKQFKCTIDRYRWGPVRWCTLIRWWIESNRSQSASHENESTYVLPTIMRQYWNNSRHNLTASYLEQSLARDESSPAKSLEETGCIQFRTNSAQVHYERLQWSHFPWKVNVSNCPHTRWLGQSRIKQ